MLLLYLCGCGQLCTINSDGVALAILKLKLLSLLQLHKAASRDFLSINGCSCSMHRDMTTQCVM